MRYAWVATCASGDPTPKAQLGGDYDRREAAVVKMRYSCACVLAACLLAACLLLLVGGAARADALVGNLVEGLRVTGSSLGIYDHSQRFTTGTSASGYKITGIRIRLGSRSTARTNIPKVRLFSQSPTGTKLADFNGPSTIVKGRGNYTFRPTSTLLLNRQTDYWMTIEDEGAAEPASLVLTLFTGEDAISAAGWRPREHRPDSGRRHEPLFRELHRSVGIYGPLRRQFKRRGHRQGRQLPRHRQAHDFRHRARGPDPDCRQGHHRRRQRGAGRLRLPVDTGRGDDRDGHLRREREDLPADRRRRGQAVQGDALLLRQRRLRRRRAPATPTRRAGPSTHNR